MKPAISIIVTLLICFSVARAEDLESKLPYQSKALVSKLSAWESEQKAQLAREIRRKREQVVQSLKQHLEVATKQGKLDDAIAIRKEIATLSSGWVEMAQPGQVWAGKHPALKGNWTLELLADGKALLTHGKVQKRLWAFEYPNILYCWHPAQTKTTGWKLTIGDSGKTAEVTTTKEGGRGKATLKRASGK